MGCTKQAIYRKAKENGWSRDLKSKIDKVTAAKLVNKPECQLTGGEPVNKPGKPDEHSAAPPIVSAPVAPPDVHAREGVGCYFGQKGSIKAFLRPKLTNLSNVNLTRDRIVKLTKGPHLQSAVSLRKAAPPRPIVSAPVDTADAHARAHGRVRARG